jgi:hypothetical protein
MYARTRVLSAILGASFVIASGAAGAAVIDFETVPGGTPSDQLAITNQYEASDGVTFSLSDGGTPFLEQRDSDDDGNGFLRNFPPEELSADIERAGHEGELGNFFLRLGIDTLFAVPVPQLIISYSTPVAAASAQIWDIDGNDFGTEQWRVEALDASDAVLATLDSPAGIVDTEESLDGLPWTWSFDLSAADIHRIRISFIGTKIENIGLSFDNFSPTEPAVPAPPAVWLFGTAMVALLHRLRRRA